MNKKSDITYFGKTNSRGQETEFGIKDEDRLRHIYIIGKTGMGKSTLLENMAVQDINKGNGMCFIDPHGSTVELFLDYIPENRIKDVIYFAPFDVQNPIAFNVLDNTGLDENSRFLVAQGLLAAFKKIFGEESFSDRMVHILNNTLLALLEFPGATMLSVTRMLTDKGYEDEVVANITDPSVKDFWINTYGQWEDRYKKEATAAVLNKLGQFTSNPLIRSIVGQEKNSIDFREIMDTKKIFLINLSKGQVGEDNAALLGSMLTTKIYLAAMSRANVSKSELQKLPNFYLYIDEFQNVVNDSFANILSEARKYKLALIMAHQYVEQMPDTVRAAIFGNVGTTIAFRVGPEDGEVLEKLFSPTFYADDIVNLGRFEIYLSLMINSVGSAPFSANSLPPIPKPDISFAQEAIEYSRKKYGNNKQEVDRKIAEWMAKKYQSNTQKRKQEKNAAKWEAKKKRPGWIDKTIGTVSVAKNNLNNSVKKDLTLTENKQNFKKEHNPNFVYKNDDDFGVVKNTEIFDKKELSASNAKAEKIKIGKSSLKEALAGLKIPKLSEKKEVKKGVKKEVKKGVKKEGEKIDKNSLKNALAGIEIPKLSGNKKAKNNTDKKTKKPENKNIKKVSKKENFKKNKKSKKQEESKKEILLEGKNSFADALKDLKI